MQAQPPSQTPSSSEFRSISENSWRSFFDSITNALRGRRAEVEVIGLDLGDQIEAEWLPLDGITYDPSDDSLYVSLEEGDGLMQHAIVHPREILVHSGSKGEIDQLVAVDADDHRYIMRLKDPVYVTPAPSA